MESRQNVSCIIVSFRTLDKLRRCLRCLDDVFEVIVVDNDSDDGSAEMVAAEFPKAKLIQNHKNVGFGTANNQGTAIASGDLWLYLNSDAYAEPGAIAQLAEAFKDDSIVAAGGLLLWPDRTVQLCSSNHLTLGRVFLEQSYLEKILARLGVEGYWNTRRLIQKAAPVDTAQVMGAAMMVRPGLELFDEQFFLYCEDTDLCRRLEQHGRIVLEHRAKFIHDLGSSSKLNPWLGIARYNLGKEIYFQKHHRSGWACFLLNRCGALLRLTFYLIASVGVTQTDPTTFWKVLTARRKDLGSR